MTEAEAVPCKAGDILYRLSEDILYTFCSPAGGSGGTPRRCHYSCLLRVEPPLSQRPETQLREVHRPYIVLDLLQCDRLSHQHLREKDAPAAPLDRTIQPHLTTLIVRGVIQTRGLG